ERSPLQAKSMLLIYGYIGSYSAYKKLEAARPKFKWELNSALKKTLEQLRSNFSGDQFQQEFDENLNNPEKLQQLGEILLLNRGASTVSFLNQKLEYVTGEALSIVAKLLEQIGQPESLRILERRLEECVLGYQIWMQWVRFALGKIKKWPILDAGPAQAGISRQFFAYVKQGLKPEALVFLYEQYRWPPKMWEPMKAILFRTFHNEQSPEDEKEHLTRQVYLLTRTPPQEILDLARSLGVLANLFQRKAMIPKFERMLREHPWEHPIVVAMLGGYRSEEGLNLLLEWLAHEEDPEGMTHLLKAISQFELKSLPKQVWKFLQNQSSDDKMPHLVQIVLRCDARQEILQQLEFNNEPFWLALMEHLIVAPFPGSNSIVFNVLRQKARSHKYYIAALKVAANIKTSESADLVRPYTTARWPWSLRAQALAAYMQNSNGRWLAEIDELTQPAEGQDGEEIWLEMVNILKKDVSPIYASGRGLRLQPWLPFLKHPKPSIALLALNILQLQDPLDYEEPQVWTEFLQNWVQVLNENESEMKTLILRILGDLKTLAHLNTPNSLAEFLEEFANLNHYHRGRWMLMLSQNAQTLCKTIDPDQQTEFSSEMVRFFEEFYHEPVMLKALIHVMSFSKLPVFRQIFEELARHPNEEIASQAKQTIDQKPSSGISIKRVWIIDDSQMIARSLTNFLNKMGFEVQFWTRYQSLAGEQPPDLLILDYFVGSDLGPNIWRELSDQWEMEPPVIYITSSRNEEVHHHIQRETPHAPLLLKPFPLSKLLECIEDIRLQGQQSAAT
ncbi:MAG: response regulator, partial [Acidobacteria bacterium]|nr:response regulator [Acidobacteriota bacterium]